MAGDTGNTFPARENDVENALGWETRSGTVRPLLSCLVSLSLSLPICKVSFLPPLNFCGSVAPLARAQGEGRRMRADTKAVSYRDKSGTDPGNSKRKRAGGKSFTAVGTFHLV